MDSFLFHIFLCSVVACLLTGCGDNERPKAPPGFWQLYSQTLSEAKLTLKEGKPAEAQARLLALYQSSSKYLPPEKMVELEDMLEKCSSTKSADKSAEVTATPRGALYLTKKANALLVHIATLEEKNEDEKKLTAHYEQVLKILEQAIREGERDDSHATLYGLAYLGAGKPRAALLNFKKAEKLAPGAPEPFMLQAACYEAIGHIDKEISALQSSILLDDDQPQVHYQLVLAYMKKGKTKKAIKHAEKAIGTAPQRASEFAEIVQDMKLVDYFKNVAQENHLRAQQQRSFENSGNLEHGMTAAPSVITQGVRKRLRRKKVVKKKRPKRKAKKRRTTRASSSSSSSSTVRRSTGIIYPSSRCRPSG